MMFVSANEGQTAKLPARGEGQRIHVLGAEITVRISAADTGGAFTVFEGLTQPLQGPPLHRHSEIEEWWYIVEGEFRFEIDGRELPARAGDIVFAPRGSRHTFQNMGTTSGRTITTVVPGGIELFFAELEKVAPRGSVPDPAKMLPVFARHQQELLGPPLRARTT